MSKVDPKAILSKARSAQEGITEAVLSLRNEIATQQLARAELMRLPVPMHVALERLRAWVAAVKTVPGTPIIRAEVFANGSDGWSPPYAEFDTAVASFILPVILSAGEQMIAEHYGTISAVADSGAKAELDRIGWQILELELAEEAIIRSAEASGFPIRRRSDADPRAVLAHDKSLP